jgi:allantoinase
MPPVASNLVSLAPRTALVSAQRERAFAALPGQGPAMRWPGGARLAVCIMPIVDGPSALHSNGSGARTEPSDALRHGWLEYGRRVGLWRMAQALAEYPVAVTAAVDPGLLEQRPEVAALVRERGWEVMGHGLLQAPAGGEAGWPPERVLIDRGAAIVRAHTGQALAGLLGWGIGQDARLLDLMAQAGLQYHAGLLHDDIPVPTRTAQGLLWSMPCHLEIADAALLDGPHDIDMLVQAACDQFDRLWHEADEEGEGLVCCWPLHPHLIGQPHTVGALRRVLDHVCSHGEVWHAQARDIVDAAHRCHEGHPAFVAWLRGSP